MPLFKHLAKLLSILCLLLLISGCRYWSLYRFADQFCHYDEQVEVISNGQTTQIVFADPVLPIHVFDRYFKALPYRSSETNEKLIQHYQLVTRYDMLERRYQLQVNFSRYSRQPLLAESSIGGKLSDVFKPEFVDAILRSSCTDDITLSLSEIDVRFVLPSLHKSIVPNLEAITTLFGPGLASANTKVHQRDYHLDFEGVIGNTYKLQNKPIFLRFKFSDTGYLNAINVDYLNYAMRLDFTANTGHLNIIRGDRP